MDFDLIKAKEIVIFTFCNGLEGEQRSRLVKYYEDWARSAEEVRTGAVTKYPQVAPPVRLSDFREYCLP